MSSDLPTSTPDPYVEDSWFQRPAFLATCALIIVLIGTVVWFLGREDEASVATTVPSPLVSGATPETDDVPVASGLAPATSGESAIDTAAGRLNPYGDVIGAPVVEPQSTAGVYARAIQAREDPAAVAALHSPAYYYALWARLRGDGTGTGVPPVATATGYAVELPGGAVELTNLAPADGPVRDGAEVRGGVTTSFEVAVQSTGVCEVDREPECDLSGANFAPDSGGSAAQMWALAKVVVDPAADTWLLYVDMHGRRLATATVEPSAHVGLDATLNVVAVTYVKAPPPGTVLTLVATADDGAIATFDFAVS